MKRFSAVPVAFLAVLTLLPNGAFADDKKKDPDEIGNRDVGKGVNFWSLEKEIALGKQLAQEVERQAKIAIPTPKFRSRLRCSIPKRSMLSRYPAGSSSSTPA